MERINIAEILKQCPEGTKLWCPMYGEVELLKIHPNSDFPIEVKTSSGKTDYDTFTEYGTWKSIDKCPNAECMLFPSKDNRYWSTFEIPKKNHQEFKPFDKVLIRGVRRWNPTLYAFWDEDTCLHTTIDGPEIEDDDILPFEGNERLINKINNE